MSTDQIPEPPKAATSWLDLLDKANRLNLIPLLLAIAIGWAYWKTLDRLEASEARTRAALAACSGNAQAVREESSKTREVVRAKSAELQQAIGVPSAAPYVDGGVR